MAPARHKQWVVALIALVLLWLAPLALALDGDTSSSRSAAPTPKRIALVIGNDAYQRVSKLQKAGNDASAMARELKTAGFDVVLHKDLNYRAMVKAVETLADRITGGDQVVVFFAGHGVQIRTGNYLLPVDIEASSEGEIEKTAYALADLTDKLSEAKASFALVLVDACRDNPIKSKGRSVGGSRGLSPIEPPKGQIVVFSASKGQQALDRLSDDDTNPNGVFTREFIQCMKQPGVKIQDLMVEVQDSVETLAQSISHDQRPAVYNEARGNFYFFGPTTVQVQGQAPSPAAADPETRTWDAAERVNSVESYQAYLNSYPKGRYVSAAKIAMAGLKQAAARPTATPVPTKPSPVPSDDPETALWKAVESGNTTEDYGVYLKQYPKGKYVALAKQRGKRIDDDARAKAEAEEQAAWQAAEGAQTAESYLAYSARYPSGRYSALAQTRANKLKNDMQAQAEAKDWERARSAHSEPAYNDYLSRYPSGRYADLAKVGQTRLQREAADQKQQETARQQREQREAAQREEQEAWQKAEAATDSATVQRYLDRYPSGPHAEQARSQLAAVKKAEAELRPGKVFKDCADCPEMVVLPAGSFQMGSNDGDADEKPVHSVSIRGFAMGKTEVTRGQFGAFVSATGHNTGSSCWSLTGDTPDRNWRNPGYSQTDNDPVACVNWDDAQAYVRWLAQKTGKSYRLPSESEWEYACRAGANQTYCGSNDVDSVAVYGRKSGDRTLPVAGKQANAWGLFDMSGNVLEWTQDCFNENYLGAPGDGSAWLAGNCGLRVLRGGAWYYNASSTRAAGRGRDGATNRNSNGGFRLARMLP